MGEWASGRVVDLRSKIPDCYEITNSWKPSGHQVAWAGFQILTRTRRVEHTLGRFSTLTSSRSESSQTAELVFFFAGICTSNLLPEWKASCVGTRGALPVALLRSSSDLFVWFLSLPALPADCSSRIFDHHARPLAQPLAFVASSFVVCPPIQAELEAVDLQAEQSFARIST
jgi:hypothetical protein